MSFELNARANRLLAEQKARADKEKARIEKERVLAERQRQRELAREQEAQQRRQQQLEAEQRVRRQLYKSKARRWGLYAGGAGQQQARGLRGALSPPATVWHASSARLGTVVARV